MIDNPLQMNDWEINKFLSVVFVVQLAMLVLVGLGALGFDIPAVRQIVGFVYLTFIPGLLILRILKLHKLGAARTLLYLVGLSLAFNMFLGFLINIFYPHIGISKPISTLPVIITWTVVLGLLCFIAYKRDKDFSMPSHFNVRELLSPPVLFLILLPLLAIVGAQLVRFYQTNVVLMMLICLLGLVPILAMFTKFIPEKLYPLAIYSTALALLWHSTLVSEYLIRFDSFLEYHVFGLVTQSGLWNLEVPDIYNAMLSITILPATFSQLLGLSGTAIFKLVYTLWFALVPLGLYEVYRSLYTNRQAFLAVFFFISIFVFFLNMPSIGRQMVAELYCVLLIMLIIDREAAGSKKGLFVIFAASLAVSHYGLSYLYIVFFVLILAILYLLREKRFQITAYSVALLTVICLAWYMYISSSEPLTQMTNLGKHVYESFNIDLLNPFSRDFAQVVASTSPDALHLAYRILWYLMLLFIAVGSTTLASDLRQDRIRKEYAALAIGSYILLGACIAIPFFSTTLGLNRMVHTASLILAPFCVLGAEIIFRSFCRAIQFIRRLTPTPTNSTITTTIILVLFFLFNTSLPFEIAKSSTGISPPLAFGHVRSGDRAFELTDTIHYWSSSPTEQEVSSAEWLSSLRNEARDVYATHWQLGVPVLVSYGMIPPEQTYHLTPRATAKDIEGSYVYLGYVNVVLGYGTTRTLIGHPDPWVGNVEHWDISQITPLLDGSAKVYTNGASEVYWSP